MASTALRRPISHEERLSLIEHLDELRSRLIVSLLVLAVIFGLCAAFNGTLLGIINKPLDTETQKNIERGRGPLGQIAVTQDAVRASGEQTIAALEALAARSSGLPAASRRAIAAQAAAIQKSLDKLPDKVTGNKPVTLGVGEPFNTTLVVSFYFALLIAMPFLLWQAYAFILPAFSDEEKRVVVPLLAMIPVLFIIGVVFGYFFVMPAAVRFLQNFNADEFNILVQARDYYRFTAITLLAVGLVFQIPVGILALTRLGVVSVEQLRRNRRYAILVLAVIAMLLPGTDPVTMLILLAPLILLYEGSILLARVFGGSQERQPAEPDDEPEPPSP
jgi:sec-independent protein translocase protein TatC